VSCGEIVNVQKQSWGYCCPHQVCCCQTGPQYLLPHHWRSLHGPSCGPPGSGDAVPLPSDPVPLHLAGKIHIKNSYPSTYFHSGSSRATVSGNIPFCIFGNFKHHYILGLALLQCSGPSGIKYYHCSGNCTGERLLSAVFSIKYSIHINLCFVGH
jgi:hypothetical protein